MCKTCEAVSAFCPKEWQLEWPDAANVTGIW